MKFISFVTTTNPQASGTPPPELMGAIAQMGMEAMQAGVLKETGGMRQQITYIVNPEGITAQDGPYAESKEMLGGYAIYEVESREEMIKWAQRFNTVHRSIWKTWEGKVEFMELVDMSGMPD